MIPDEARLNWQLQYASPAMLRPAILFDRDGTLIRDDGFTHRTEDLEWLPGALEAISYANRCGWLVIVVTNQSGIARGLYDEATMHRFHAAMQDALAEAGGRIDAFYHCPYHANATVSTFASAEHPDRKPAPGMLRRATIEWSLDVARSMMIGDRLSDIEAGKAAGMRTALAVPGSLLLTVQDAIADANVASSTVEIAPLDGLVGQWRRWLFETALPYWVSVGFDANLGCFHERLSLTGEPIIMPRRIRVQARQLFVYARAGQLGWTGPWKLAVEGALEVLLAKGLRPDGGTCHLLAPDGSVLDDRRDLYDLAFVLLGLAQAIAIRPGDERPVVAARVLTRWLDDTWAHPAGGYHEGEIVSGDVRRQNPHMHLLEAFLALAEVTGEDIFRQRALDMGHLGRDRLFQPSSGAIPEYFDSDWRPHSDDRGVIVEPGHQFEWSYLFSRLNALGQGSWLDIADQLRVTGEVYGVDPRSGMVFEEILLNGQAVTMSSRLWSHAERVKANLQRIRRQPDAIAKQAVTQGLAALMAYCNAAGPALWLERRDQAGRFSGQDVLASSLYHIVGAAEELITYGTGRLL